MTVEAMNRRQAMTWAALVAGAGVARPGALAGAAGEPAQDAGPLFNVRDFGAAADGADATAAVARALDACLKARRGTLYFPAGSYSLSKPLEVDLPPGTGLAVRGDGPGVSRLTWTNEPGGIAVRFHPEGGFDGEKGTILVDGLSLLTTHASAGAAVQLACRGGTSPSPKKLLRDLILAGTSATAGWAVGIDCVNCTFTTLDGLDYQGPGQSTGVAVRFSGDRDPVDNYLTRLRVFGASTGLEVTGNCEGVYLTQSTMIAVERGVHWHTTAGEPLLAMSGCHVAASRECVLGHNLIQSIITGNLLYQSPQSGDANTEWAGVRLTADAPSIYDLLQVSQNTIHGFPGPAKTRTGIAVAKRRGGIVQGNVIQGVDVGVALTDGTADMKVLDNVVREAKVADVAGGEKGNVIRRV
jgi:hypothetical protein